MIFDKWENLKNLRFSAQLTEIVLQVQDLRQKNLEEGKYDLCHGAFLSVMKFSGKSENVYEAHRKFVDIHFVIEGSERINVVFVSDIESEKAVLLDGDIVSCPAQYVDNVYDEEKDLIFYTKKYAAQAHVYLDETSFLLVMPEDAHAPCLYGKQACEKSDDGACLEKASSQDRLDKNINLKGVVKIPVQCLL